MASVSLIIVNNRLRVIFAPLSDAQVSTFRKWFDTFGGAVPTCSIADISAMGPALSKEQARVQLT